MSDESTTVETPEPTTTKTPESKAPDPAKVAESLVNKYGSAEAAIVQLANENYKERDKVRELKAKLPPEGSVILSGDEAKAWAAYQSLGKPEDVKKIKSEHAELQSFKAVTERNNELANVAKTAGVEFEVLKTIAGPNLSFEIKPVKDAKTGEEVPTVFVKDGEDEPKPFEAYATAKWSPFLPALKPDAKVEPKVNGTPRHMVPVPKPTDPPTPREQRRREPSLVR